jgi:hypothetical protein
MMTLSRFWTIVTPLKAGAEVKVNALPEGNPPVGGLTGLLGAVVAGGLAGGGVVTTTGGELVAGADELGGAEDAGAEDVGAEDPEDEDPEVEDAGAEDVEGDDEVAGADDVPVPVACVPVVAWVGEVPVDCAPQPASSARQAATV